MKSNFKNFKKKKLAEEKAIAKQLAKKKKKAVTLTVSIVVAVLVVFALVIGIVLLVDRNSDGESTETTFSNGTKAEIELPETYRVVTVHNADMEPTISVGDNVSVSTVNKATELKAGDVVYFLASDHDGKTINKFLRIQEVSVENGQYLFKVKGDANAESEVEVIHFSKIEGKLVQSFGDVDIKDLVINGSAE